MKNTNTHNSRESWLRSATNELRPYFEKLGYTLPEKIRFAIAFPSSGRKGHAAGECWHPDCSEDGHFEIIIRADYSDPVEVLGVLTHELVHTLFPPLENHGKLFKVTALRIGLEGPMRSAMPSPILRERLNGVAASLGPLPHAKLNFAAVSDAPKKQRGRLLKAECPADCGYTFRIAAKWATAGLPVCPINAKHGALVCKEPDIENANADG